VISYLLETEISVIVSYLEVEANNACQLGEVSLAVAEQLHQSDRQHEQTAGLCSQKFILLNNEFNCL
jgi:hypothetical protein